MQLLPWQSWIEMRCKIKPFILLLCSCRTYTVQIHTPINGDGRDEKSLILCVVEGDNRVVPVAGMEKNQSKLWAVNNPSWELNSKQWYYAACSKQNFTSSLPDTALDIKGNIRFTSSVATPALFLSMYFCSCGHNICLQCCKPKLMVQMSAKFIFFSIWHNI